MKHMMMHDIYHYKKHRAKANYIGLKDDNFVNF